VKPVLGTFAAAAFPMLDAALSVAWYACAALLSVVCANGIAARRAALAFFSAWMGVSVPRVASVASTPSWRATASSIATDEGAGSSARVQGCVLLILKLIVFSFSSFVSLATTASARAP
jgi:hypothetical protein